MDKQELKAILGKHLKWLRGEDGGERANLSGAYLSGAYLSGANLSGPTTLKRQKIYFIPLPARKSALLSAGKRQRAKPAVMSAL